MKCQKIELFTLHLPYAGGTYELSHGRTYDGFDSVMVCLTSDTGLEGWGESTPFGATYIAAHAKGAASGIEEIAPHLLGCDIQATDRVTDIMDEALLGHNHAKSAIDLAMWDLFGKAVGLPVYQLLGGSTGHPLPVISSIYAGAPEDMRARVADHRQKGYRGHSVKIGASEAEGGPALDAERIAASLADRQPGEYFIVDANGGLTSESARRLLRLLPAGLDFVLEAPCASWPETLSLRAHCDVPLVIDELLMSDSDMITLIKENAADGIGLKISKAGGLTHAKRHRDMAIAAGLTMSVQDTVGSTLSAASIFHLGATVPPSLLRCVLDVRDMVTRPTGTFSAPLIAGGVMPPDSPGLGVTIDRDALGPPAQIWEA